MKDVRLLLLSEAKRLSLAHSSEALVEAISQALHELTIGVVCSTRTPCQDVVGVCLHCSAAVSILASAKPLRVEIGMPVFCD